MKKKIATLVTAGALLLSVVPALAKKPANTPNNGKSHEKATGEVTWTARSGALPGIVTSFNAHDIYPDNSQLDKGTIETYRPTDPGFDEGTIVIDVACVRVEGDEAWFAGTATSATGGYSGNVGHHYIYWVHDKGTPGNLVPDLIGGNSYPTLKQACSKLGSWTGSGEVTDGNLVVHSSE